MDGECSPVTPNTIVYTPRGVVHRFQMFTEFATVGIRTRMTGRKRAAHLHVPEDGIPSPSAPGLVVPGTENTGPIPVPHATCPVRELHLPEQASADSGVAAEARVGCDGSLRLVTVTRPTSNGNPCGGPRPKGALRPFVSVR
jgi:hypothetical protein